MDLDADGRRDLVVTNQGSNNVSVLLAQGNGQYAAAQNFPAGTSPFHSASADA